MWTKTCTRANNSSTECAKTGARCGVAIAGKHACRRSWARRKGRVAAEHGDTRAVLRTAERDHVLTDVAANELAMLGTTVRQDILDEIVAELITSDLNKVSHRSRIRGNSDSLSIRGMRGRSGRASHIRSRYRSRNSLPPIFRHFSITLEAYWSMLYSVLKRRM